MNVPITDIRIGPRHRQDLGDLASLKASIQELGLLNAVIVSADRFLICGRRRLEACRELGHAEIECREADIDSLLAERDENECRKEFTVTERVAIAKAIE